MQNKCVLEIYYIYCKNRIHYIDIKRTIIQCFQISHSDSASLLVLVYLPGSLKDISTSPYFYQIFKQKFELLSLDLWWMQTQADTPVNFATRKCIAHIQNNTKDSIKQKDTLVYFNQKLSSIDNNFFGNKIRSIPILKPFLDDDVKDRIIMHVHK